MVDNRQQSNGFKQAALHKGGLDFMIMRVMKLICVTFNPEKKKKH